MDVATLITKQEIRDHLARYCRAMDRMDRALADSLWHRDATVDYVGVYQGSSEGFLDWVWMMHAELQTHSHQITNVLCDVDGNEAASESYVTVALWTRPDESGTRTEITARGRYLDNWSHKEGRWAIERRTYITDMQSQETIQSGEHPPGGTRDEDDLSYKVLPTNFGMPGLDKSGSERH